MNLLPAPPQEEELRKSGEAKYAHLSNDLHVLIEVFAPPGEAYSRMSHALEEIKKFLVPVSFDMSNFSWRANHHRLGFIASPSGSNGVNCAFIRGLGAIVRLTLKWNPRQRASHHHKWKLMYSPIKVQQETTCEASATYSPESSAIINVRVARARRV